MRTRKGMTVHTRVKQAQRGLLTSNSTKVKKSVPTSVVDKATLKNRKRSTANILKKVFDYKLYVRSIKYLTNYCPCVFFLVIFYIKYDWRYYFSGARNQQFNMIKMFLYRSQSRPGLSGIGDPRLYSRICKFWKKKL